MSEVAQEAAAPAGDEAPNGEQPETEIPSFEADTSGIEDYLDGPDDEPDDEPIVNYTTAEVDDEFEDPAVRELKQRLVRAEAQLQHEKGLRAQNNLKSWREEAGRRFPLADVDEIDATSRRSVLRKAKEQHERYERKLGPVLERLDTLRDEVISEARQEVREKAAQSWGAPTTGPSAPTMTASEGESMLDPRKYKNPQELLAARFKHDPNFQNGI